MTRASITGRTGLTATGSAAAAIFRTLTAPKEEDTMTKRIKPTLQGPAITTPEEADAILAEIAAHRRKIELYELRLRDDVDALKTECADKCEAHKQAIAAREQALMTFALARKSELFAARKSLALSFGTVGFRASTALQKAKKYTWERVLTLIKERDIPAVRTKEEVDKDALRGLDAGTLAGLGCKLVTEDTFFYELADADVTPGE